MTEDPSNPLEPLERSLNSGSTSPGSAEPETGDAALINGVLQRDQAAMAAIFDRYGRMVYSVALRVLKEPAAAEDVMQQIFFEVWETPRNFVAGRGSLAGWLAVVARNRAVDVLRRRKPSDPVEEVELAADTNLAADAERNIMMEKVRTHLDTLPRDQQDQVQLAFFEGLSHSEISAQTGVPLGTVKTRIRSALISLREAVQA
ncbi:MAG: sigma-70 family RNA polymerase sigma factor [Terracidiphilus sp.]|jgi:RNA polymerase sigma-70 factor (ECF subfamily)